MHKITKPEVRCEKCKQLIARAEYDRFCDSCGERIRGDYTPVSFHFKKRDMMGYEVCSGECLINLLEAKRGLNYRAVIIHTTREHVLEMLDATGDCSVGV